MKKRILQFSILALLLIVACAIPLRVADAATGSLSANSQFVYISSGLGSTTISWSTSGCTTGQVYVNQNNTQDKLMSQGASGSANIGWIVAGQSYTFKLYKDTARTELLASVVVIGYGTNSGNIGAYETEAIAPAAGGNASMKLAWGTNGYANAQVYVSVNGGAEALMSAGTTGNATPSWIVPGYKYDFKLYANTTHTTLLDTITVYGRRQAYDVGPNYLALGANMDTSGFLANYHEAGIRSAVQTQLQGIANAGASILKLTLSMVIISGTANEKWKLHFPPTAQELTNIHTLVQDIAAIQATDGHRLKVAITLLRFWDANYTIGTPATGLGHSGLTAAQYTAREEDTYEGIIDQVYNIYRPDGQKVVDRIYQNGEVMIGTKANSAWFVSTHYPGFVSYCNSHGIVPSMYFIVLSPESDILDNNFTDGTYSILNNHKSMYYAYRSVRYLYDNGLHIPDRIDLSSYPEKANSTYEVLATRIIDDAEAVFPSLGARKYHGFVETHYFDPTSYQGNVDREALGAAFAKERLRDNRVVCTIFWTTPAPQIDTNNDGIPDSDMYPPAAYPFQVGDYMP